MQTTKYTPQEEQALMSRLWSAKLRDDPEAFVMFVFPWGEKGYAAGKAQRAPEVAAGYSAED
jgi:hypothetical protein